jgi:hypothetical protein
MTAVLFQFAQNLPALARGHTADPRVPKAVQPFGDLLSHSGRAMKPEAQGGSGTRTAAVQNQTQLLFGMSLPAGPPAREPVLPSGVNLGDVTVIPISPRADLPSPERVPPAGVTLGDVTIIPNPLPATIPARESVPPADITLGDVTIIPNPLPATPPRESVPPADITLGDVTIIPASLPTTIEENVSGQVQPPTPAPSTTDVKLKPLPDAPDSGPQTELWWDTVQSDVLQYGGVVDARPSSAQALSETHLQQLQMLSAVPLPDVAPPETPAVPGSQRSLSVADEKFQAPSPPPELTPEQTTVPRIRQHAIQHIQPDRGTVPNHDRSIRVALHGPRPAVPTVSAPRVAETRHQPELELRHAPHRAFEFPELGMFGRSHAQAQPSVRVGALAPSPGMPPPTKPADRFPSSAAPHQERGHSFPAPRQVGTQTSVAVIGSGTPLTGPAARSTTAALPIASDPRARESDSTPAQRIGGSARPMPLRPPAPHSPNPIALVVSGPNDALMVVARAHGDGETGAKLRQLVDDAAFELGMRVADFHLNGTTTRTLPASIGGHHGGRTR